MTIGPLKNIIGDLDEKSIDYKIQGNQIDAEIKNNLSLRDKQIVLTEKFYDRGHLLDFIEENYHHFLSQTLPNYLKQNKKIFLCTIYNKKEAKNYVYYLHIKRPELEDCSYLDEKRRSLTLTNKMAIEKGVSRELDLKATVYVTEQPENEPEKVTTITTTTKQVSLAKIPLLTNSRYDKDREKNPHYYAFLIKGVYRILYNVLTTEENSLARYENLLDGKAAALVLPRIAKNNSHYTRMLINNTNIAPIFYFGSMSSQAHSCPLHILLRILGYDLENLKKNLAEIYEKYDLPDTSLNEYLALLEPESNRPWVHTIKSFLDIVGLKTLKNWLYINQKTGMNIDQYTFDPEDPKTLTIIKDYLDQKFLFDVTKETDYQNTEELKKKKITTILEKITDLLLRVHKIVPFRLPDHLGDKKLLTYDDHLKIAFSRAFTKWIEKTQLLAVKELGAVKRSRTATSLIRSELISKEIKKYLTQQTISKSSSLTVSASSVESYTEALSASNNLELYALQRRVISNLNKEALNVYQRSVTPMKVGRVCIVDTPNSRAVGLAEKLALGAKLSFEIPTVLLKTLYKYVDVSNKEKNRPLVSLDNSCLGYCKISANALFEKLKPLKIKYGLSYNIEHDRNGAIAIRSSAGRILKPMLNVDNSKVLLDNLNIEDLRNLSIEDMIKQNILTFIDVDEELSSSIALNRGDITEQTQYLVAPASLYLAYGTNYLVFCNNNAAHRTTLALRLLKQGLGLSKKDLYSKTKNKTENLISPRYAMIQSPFESYYKDIMGVNAIMAFYSGQNEEDSIYCNKTALDRGLFRYTINKRLSSYSKYDINNGRYVHQEPLSEDIAKQTNISYDGTLRKGYCNKNDTIMYNTILKEDNKEAPRPWVLDQNGTYLNDVELEYSNLNSMKVTYSFSKSYDLHIGDKFGTKTGLKGVVGHLQPEIGLPMSKNGVTPAVYFSSHVINARMTLGPLLEILLSKGAVLKGTPWAHRAVETKEYLEYTLKLTRKLLANNNMNASAYDTFYDSAIGSEVSIYCGPTKFFLLEQHALEKYYARGKSGSYNYLTRQPSEGKKVKGGLRFGSMEAEACFEQSATNFVKDRMNIDLVPVHICSKCNRFTHQLHLNVDLCYNCKKKDYIRKIHLPYPFVLLSKVLRACHIETIFELEDWDATSSLDAVSFTGPQVEEKLQKLKQSGLLDQILNNVNKNNTKKLLDQSELDLNEHKDVLDDLELELEETDPLINQNL